MSGFALAVHASAVRDVSDRGGADDAGVIEGSDLLGEGIGLGRSELAFGHEHVLAVHLLLLYLRRHADRKRRIVVRPEDDRVV